MTSHLNKLSIPKHIETDPSKYTVKSWFQNSQQPWFTRSLLELLNDCNDPEAILSKMQADLDGLQKERNEILFVLGIIYFFKNTEIENKCFDNCIVKRWSRHIIIDNEKTLLPKHLFSDLCLGKKLSSDHTKKFSREIKIFTDHMISFGFKAENKLSEDKKNIEVDFKPFESFIKNYSGITSNCKSISDVKSLLLRSDTISNLSSIHFFSVKNGCINEANLVDESHCIFDRILSVYSKTNPEELLEIFKQYYDVILFGWDIDCTTLDPRIAKTQIEEITKGMSVLFHGVDRLVRRYCPDLVDVIKQRISHDAEDRKIHQKNLLSFVSQDL